MDGEMDRAWSIMVMIWAFMARSKMHTLLSSEKKEPEWFHGFWTFFFNALYFIYKVNTLYETLPDRTIRLS